MSSNAFLAEADFQKIFKDHLRIEAFPKSIESLFGPRMRSKVNYSPYYQRHYVWDKAKASYFIESILLGTEIPPLVFFSSNGRIEVIDGRQRYETIKRFMDDTLPLVSSGLERLKRLGRTSYSRLPNDVSALFLDTKLRIIQFEIIGEPPLDGTLEDKIKKEIFRRYNTGITPLRRAELDNAIYDSDDLTQELKDSFTADATAALRVQRLFLHTQSYNTDELNLSQVLQFIRRMTVLHKYPIKYYARTSGRSEILAHLYECFAQHDCEDPKQVFATMDRIVTAIERFRENARSYEVATNRFFHECLLWAMLILEQENQPSVEFLEEKTSSLIQLAHANRHVFFHEASHFFKVILGRYSCIADFFTANTPVNFSVYVTGGENAEQILTSHSEGEDTGTRLSQLGELRVNKPDPSKVSVDDIIKKVVRRRFLLRPSYQRGEVISPTKASGIIESILLGIALPPIFVYRRNDDISEVVDGQQRLLTILGFIGEPYLNETNVQQFPKNHRFALRELRILTELTGKRFDDLSEEQKGKIFDFELFVVEIQERLNPNFDPVDLFVRLNDKPFPIREHSFEMWNSWADKDCITKIRDFTDRASSWFYVRQRSADDRYRMQNEELYTTLAFFDYHSTTESASKHPTLFVKRNTIAARISDKSDISTLWTRVADDSPIKKSWLDSIGRVESFLRKLKIVLVDKDVDGDVDLFLRNELDELVKSPGQRYAHRTFQDFYFLWIMLNPINLEMVRFNRLEIKKRIRQQILEIRLNMTLQDDSLGDPAVRFNQWLHQFHLDYRKDDRREKLGHAEKAELIKRQGGRCAISGAPIFVGDDISVDHAQPLALGGPDVVANLQITSPEANLRKGGRMQGEDGSTGG